MESTFEVNGKVFKVIFSMLGHEKYIFNGNILLSRWSFKFKDRLSFDCDGNKVEIDVSLSRENWAVRAFVNGVVVKEELFPELKSKIERAKNGKGITIFFIIKNLILWLILAVIIFMIFQIIK
ncbi:hypothetical protein [Cellvibrio fontiphilus]|uniref:DUF4178 domain-containing protein n=1 Tax=Cellvibrio fontiphilus TaxID=1815559 RepID=A0ABV7FF05_9GAMM